LPDGVGEDFHALPLFTERFVITSAPGHRFEALNAVRLEDLCDERYLSRAACEFADHVRALCAERGVSLIRPYRSERDDWVQSMVRAGLGIGFTPEFSITIPDLVVRPLIEPEIARKVELVTVRGRPHSAPVGAFVRHAIRFSWPVPRAEAA
jgi:DNA-binding transcriptional LysR family regulator